MQVTYYEIWGQRPGKDAPEVIMRLVQGDQTAQQMQQLCEHTIQMLTQQHIVNITWRVCEVD